MEIREAALSDTWAFAKQKACDNTTLHKQRDRMVEVDGLFGKLQEMTDG